MKKLLLLLILSVCLFAKVLAQSFPYLNASTGNAGEFIVDADSNIVMFHGSKIEKLDKNFNLIWANSYSDLRIKNLLLSKTGSLFFISNSFNGSAYVDRVGKIEANGNFSWSKELPTYTAVVSGNTQTVGLTSANQLFLDRNNHLIITGGTYPGGSGNNMYLIKLDTLGTPIHFKLFESQLFFDFSIASIISDVSGIYTISAWGYDFEGPVFNLLLKYSDVTNEITTSSICWADGRGSMNQTPISNELIIKSKNEPNTYYLSYNKGAFSSTLYNTFNLKKFRDTVLVWGAEFYTTPPFLIGLQNIEEDPLKNAFLSFTAKNINTEKNDKWIIKIDSSGISDNTKHHFMPNFGAATMSAADSTTHLKYHYGNKYFYAIQSLTSLSSPLSITKMDSTIDSYCSPTATINVISTPGGNGTLASQSTITAVPSFSMQSKTSVVTNLISYSVTTNSCIAANVMDHTIPNPFFIYPNPAVTEITISSFNFSVDRISIFDVSGKCVMETNDKTSINVSKLSPGLYFIKLKTDQGELSRKFIKE